MAQQLSQFLLFQMCVQPWLIYSTVCIDSLLVKNYRPNLIKLNIKKTDHTYQVWYLPTYKYPRVQHSTHEIKFHLIKSSIKNISINFSQKWLFCVSAFDIRI